QGLDVAHCQLAVQPVDEPVAAHAVASAGSAPLPSQCTISCRQACQARCCTIAPASTLRSRPQPGQVPQPGSSSGFAANAACAAASKAVRCAAFFATMISLLSVTGCHTYQL